MKKEIRIFNDKGINLFRDYLQNLRDGIINEIPENLLTTREFTVPLNDEIFIDPSIQENKEDLVKYIYPIIMKSRINNLFYNTYLWSWLAAAYFNSICPVNLNGIRKVGADDRYILNASQWNRYYRHLIAAPIRLYHEISDKKLAKFYLFGKSNIHSDIFEQMAANINFASVKGILEALIKLYWDDEKEKPKVSASDRKKPGNLRRLLRDILLQFELTYDLNSMSGEEIISLLPKEFKIWNS